MVLAEQLRDVGLRVIVHAGPKSMRAQFRRADNSGALAAIILGQSELETQQASVKWLRAPALNDEQPQQEQVDFAQCEIGRASCRERGKMSVGNMMAETEI